MVSLLYGVSLIIWLASTQASKEIAGFTANFTGDFEKESIYAEIMPGSTRPVNAGVESTRNPSGSHKQTTTDGVPARSSKPDSPNTRTPEETARIARVIKDHEDKDSAAQKAESTIMFYEDTTRIDQDNSDVLTVKVKIGRVAETPDQASTAKAGSSGTDVSSTKLTRASTTDSTTVDWRAVHSDFTGDSPPSISKPITKERVVIMESSHKNVSRFCEADGFPKPTYKWYRDGRLINNADEFVKAHDNGLLFFPEFSKREDGLYHCTATNTLGTSMSVKVPIIFERPPGDANLNIPGRFDAKDGDAVNIPCADTPPTVPETFKRWYNVNGTAQVQMDARVGTDAQGVLRFAYVNASDAKSYICAVAPEVAVGRDIIRLYNTAILTVLQGNLKATRPRLVYASPHVKATIGGKAVLECFFSGYPVARVTWENASYQEVKDDNDRFSIQFGRRLTINKVREEDNGTYFCSGQNGQGKADVTKIELNVTGPPQKIPYQGLDRVIKAEMDKAVLLCKAKAINRQNLDTPVWFRNGHLLTTGNLPFPERYQFSADHTELHIENLSKQHDTACYQCNVSNSEGYVFYDGYLQVIDAINITRRPPDTIIVSSNGSHDISIYATHDACCGLDKRWFFNGTLLTDNDLGKLPFRKEGDRLLFEAFRVDNSTLVKWLGHYSYHVSNNYQKVRVEFRLLLEKPVPAEEQTGTEAAMNLWWVGLLVAVLVSIIAVVIVIVLVKSNYPRDTYPLGKAEIKHNLDPEQDLLDQSFQEF